MEAQAEPANGQAELINTIGKVYDFTAPADEVPRIVENNGRRFTLTAILKRRSLLDLIERQKETSFEIEAIAGGEEVERMRVDQANASLFRKVVQGGRVQELDVKDAPVKERTREQMLALTVEQQSAFIRRLYRISSKVIEVTGEDDDDLAFLNESAGEMVVRQSVGDPLAPDFEILYHFQKPSQSLRDQYTDATQIRSKRRGDKPRRAIVTDLRKSYQVALGMLVGTEQAIGEPSEIDPMFLTNAADAALAWFNKDNVDF